MSVTDIRLVSETDKKRALGLSEKQEDLRGRLQQAALELFRERGYERTTAAQIAARAGVTERTFFRQFPDKREVLFGGEATLRNALFAAMMNEPAEHAPLELLFRAFRSVLPLLENNRPFAKPRQEIIATTPALHEREAAKLETLAGALALVLQERGVPDATAVLAARVGMIAFAQATIAWLDEPEPSLSERLDMAARDLKALVIDLVG